ncbi:MarR family transcriptional regulator [Ochrobactrum sp. 695/2009]|jgi:DNA-binding MarR family transcriptional regulator|uniref:MarR family winged helix-turn-helix transcriptional regulator n=1 Tax=Ochrobactrum sp. CGA5 TaxID=2583453 RepID=UPI000C28EB94|nr:MULTISPECIES: MarR family transcriptional regulator [Brucella/Ochrobactrum group]PJR87422.1 MarR family transcriptional regulator [Ochrobactrum sp. 721/2009]PJT15669.1 MarR family transcriptional regulator [Ochrobactrum sp. 720/2009]PJT23370.1 MarR family transcriptional regulator [Ochrobactrum sp. 695/2009]PJT23968.1 MarR family transcriptional regulator [Ochrobactrum sp. 715/2009]PJT31846.1 MarR family transcriptional regulator [Ochrobactrum sp. 689/2009]
MSSSDLTLFGTTIHRVAQLIQQRIDNEMGDSGLTRLSWMAAASSGLTIGDLAGRLEVGRATPGQLVDRMVPGGWVERWASPDDRRLQIVTATPKASAMLEELAPRQSALQHEILQDLSADERRILLALLERIKSRLGR